MITAHFKESQGSLLVVEVSGHADYDEYGLDIVCAGVTSALQMCINGIIEVLDVNAHVLQEENLIRCTLPTPAPQNAIDFLNALYLHYTTLEEDYPTNIKILRTEV